MEELPETIRPARAAAREYTETLLRFPNVIGCGVGYRTVAGQETDEWALVAFVVRKLPQSALRSDEIIPRELTTSEGQVLTDVIEVSEPRLLVDTAQYRPVIGGCQIVSVSGAGTLGGNLYDSTDLQPVLLTCNHCLTLPGQRTYIPNDDRVWQPSSAVPSIGRTKRIVPMFPGPLGAYWAYDAQVDAGIVSPNAVIGVSFNVIDLGHHPYFVQAARPGLRVTKRGAVTERTEGSVTHIDVAVIISDSNGQRLRIGGTDSVFSIKRIGGNFALPGDSGAVVIDSELGSARGMVFGGDTAVSGFTYACDLDAVISALRLQTACTGGLHSLVNRAILRRRPEAWALSQASGRGIVQEMTRKADRFRNLYLPSVTADDEGGALGGTLRLLVPDMAEALYDDEDFIGLVDEAIGDWLVLPTIYDMLEYHVPDDFGSRVLKAVERLKERQPKANTLAPLIEPILSDCSGKKMRELLKSVNGDSSPEGKL